MPFLVQQQIARLDVAVDDALLVGVLEPASRLQDAIDRLPNLQRPMILDDAGQVMALDVFHHQVVHALVLVGVVGRDDVGMRELGRRFHLAVESLDGLGPLHGRRGEDLDRHRAFHPPVPGLQHYPHAAFAQLVQNDVLAEDQPLGLALVDGLGLVLGEFALLDEDLGELLDILGPLLGRKALLDRGDFGRRQQAALGQPLNELLDGDRHRQAPPADHRGMTAVYYTQPPLKPEAPSLRRGITMPWPLQNTASRFSRGLPWHSRGLRG